MSITEQDVARLARLARIELSAGDVAKAQQELTNIMGLIEQLQAIDASGVEPLAHPLSAQQDIALRLRPDAAAPTASEARRDALMANAPASQDGLFLVPTIIE